MANTAAAVSLILFESQTRLRTARGQAIWAHSERIGRATDPSTPSIQQKGRDCGGTHIPTPQQFLDRFDYVSGKRVAEGLTAWRFGISGLAVLTPMALRLLVGRVNNKLGNAGGCPRVSPLWNLGLTDFPPLFHAYMRRPLG